MLKTALSYFHSVWLNISMWQTDRQRRTDGRTAGLTDGVTDTNMPLIPSCICIEDAQQKSNTENYSVAMQPHKAIITEQWDTYDRLNGWHWFLLFLVEAVVGAGRFRYFTNDNLFIDVILCPCVDWHMCSLGNTVTLQAQVHNTAYIVTPVHSNTAAPGTQYTYRKQERLAITHDKFIKDDVQTDYVHPV